MTLGNNITVFLCWNHHEFPKHVKLINNRCHPNLCFYIEETSLCEINLSSKQLYFLINEKEDNSPNERVPNCSITLNLL